MQFNLGGLDHVAIHVKDMQRSVEWYKKVLGLKKYSTPEWGDYPIFMLAGKTGLAIFPAKLDDPYIDPRSENVKIDHFAFHISLEEFEQAVKHYEDLGLVHSIKDHHYFMSLYTRDPDKHIVELTAIKVDPDSFYK